MATQAPPGMSPLASIQAVRSSGVTCASGSPSALAAMSTTQSGQTRLSTGIASTESPSAEKWSGASTWVPVCSLIVSSKRLNPSCAKAERCSAAKPGSPK